MDCIVIRDAALAAGALTLVDIATGVARAAMNRELSSDGWLRGLWRKMAIILAMALAIALQYAASLLPMDLDINVVVPVACYLCLTEATSAYENIREIDPDLRPDAFEDIFEVNNRGERERDDLPGDDGAA